MNLDPNLGSEDDPITFDICNGTCYLYTLWALITRGLTLPYWWCIRQEKMIPLDRIQDVDIDENCLQRCCSIAEITVKTAAGGKNSGVKLIAPMNPKHVRNQIMAKRDAFMNGRSNQSSQGAQDTAISTTTATVPTVKSAVELAAIESSNDETKGLLAVKSNPNVPPSAATWNNTLCRMESKLTAFLDQRN